VGDTPLWLIATPVVNTSVDYVEGSYLLRYLRQDRVCGVLSLGITPTVSLQTAIDPAVGVRHDSIPRFLEMLWESTKVSLKAMSASGGANAEGQEMHRSRGLEAPRWQVERPRRRWPSGVRWGGHRGWTPYEEHIPKDMLTAV
jgi:hypothetical protein